MVEKLDELVLQKVDFKLVIKALYYMSIITGDKSYAKAADLVAKKQYNK